MTEACTSATRAYPGIWSSLNSGLRITQFYKGAVDPTGQNVLALGGAQDNFTSLYTGSPAWPQVFNSVTAAIAPFPRPIPSTTGRYPPATDADNYDAPNTGRYLPDAQWRPLFR